MSETNQPPPEYLVCVAFVKVETGNAFTAEIHMGSAHPLRIITSIPSFNIEQALKLINDYKPQVIFGEFGVPGFTHTDFLSLREKIDAPVALVGLAGAGTAELDEIRQGGYDASFSIPLNPTTLRRIIESVPEIYTHIRSGWGKGMWGLSAMKELQSAAAASGGAEWERTSLALFSPKGGVGKTWIAVELAAMLAGIGGRKVALVDANMNGGHIRDKLDLKASHSIANAASSYFDNKNHPSSKADIPKKILSLMVSPGLSNLSVLPGIISMDHATRDFISGSEGKEFMGYLIGLLKKHFDFVIVDVGSSTNVGVHRGALHSVDMIYMVATSDIVSLADNKIVVEKILKGDFGIPPDRIRLVVNMWDDRVGFSLKQAAQKSQITSVGLIPLDKTNAPTLAGNAGKSYVATYANQKGNPREIEQVLDGLANLAGNLYSPVIEAWAGRGGRAKQKKRGFLRKK